MKRERKESREEENTQKIGKQGRTERRNIGTEKERKRKEERQAKEIKV